MQKNFHESFAEGKIELPSDKSTGLVFAVVSLVAAYFFRDIEWALIAAISSSLGFTAISFIKPGLLRPLNILWFKFSLLLNRIMSPLIMAILFFLVVVPFGLLMRIWRYPMQASPATDKNTYWVDCDQEQQSVTSMKNQF